MEDVLPYAVEDYNRLKMYIADGQAYSVKMISSRYHLFAKNNKCVSCGLEGMFMKLERCTDNERPHFNMYGMKDGREVLFTQDHIRPLSAGGRDHFFNLQTMCFECNMLKQSSLLGKEELSSLKSVQDWLVRNEDG